MPATNPSCLQSRYACALLLICSVILCTQTACAMQPLRPTLAHSGEALGKIYVSQPLEYKALTRRQVMRLAPGKRIDYHHTLARAGAIEDLRYHLKKMTGADFEVVVTDDPASVKAPGFVYGELAVKLGAKARHKTVNGEAFRLIVRDDGLVLFGGESDTAASHAVFDWLAKLGCRWIMPGPNGEVIPSIPTLTAVPLDIAKAPAFAVRSPFLSGGPSIITATERKQFDVWLRRMQQTLRRPINHPEYLQGGHMWASLIATFKEEFKNDPSMLAQQRQPDGTFAPTKAQLEPTHPGVIDLTVRYIRKYFQRHNLPNDAAIALSVGPNDGSGYSQSPATYAVSAGRIDPITGGTDETDSLILYANLVQEAVADEFPNLKLGWYIYSVHADYPMRHKPNPKFVGNFADITYSRYHSIRDKNSYTRTYYRNILEQWAQLHKEQGNPLWYYGYNWNLAENMFPYTKVRLWGEDLPYYHAMGVLGHNNEQDKAWSILGPHNHIMARLGWDIDTTWQDLLREYCNAAFGNAAEAMMKYYLLLDQTQTDAGVESGSFPTVPVVLDKEFVQEAKVVLAQAARDADTPFYKRNVDWFGQSVFALEIYHKLLDAIHDADYESATNHYTSLLAHWQRYLDEDSNLVSRYATHYLNRWYMKPFLDKAVKHSTSDYRLLRQLPESLPTRFDPLNKGTLMGFAEPTLDHSKLPVTQTYRSTWDAQGLGTYRDGGVWYYDTFKLDKALDQDQGVGLFIGGVEDTAHVWVNGQYIGMKRGYIAPDVFDLTTHTKVDGENVLAIQIIRRGKVNEAGLGGMIHPSFIFVGPRLERVAPVVEPLRRVLPGGARDTATQP